MMNLRLAAGIVIPLLAIAVALPARAALNISSLNSEATIDFEGTVSGVNFGEYLGGGFEPATTTTGRLDSNSWAATGVSDGSVAFGGTQTTGDFARGPSAGAVATGGFYNFTTSGTNNTLGFQPENPAGGGPDDFQPGSITLMVTNTSSSPAITFSSWSISYDIFQFNDQASSSSVDFSYSTDGSVFTAVPALDFDSPTTSTGATWSTAINRSTVINASVPSSESLFLRWTINFTGGNNSQGDQVAIDNIGIAAIPEPAAFLFGTLVCSVLGLAAVGRRLKNKLLARD